MTASSMLDGTNESSTQRARRQTVSRSAGATGAAAMELNASMSATVASAKTGPAAPLTVSVPPTMLRRTTNAHTAMSTASTTYPAVHK